MTYRMLIWGMILAGGFATGCSQNATPPPTSKPPEVFVDNPVKRTITDYEVFTGRTEAREMVDIRSRVTGYLKEAPFKEGADLNLNDLIAKIDPEPFEAELERTKGMLVQAEARAKRLATDYQRAVSLLAKSAIGQEEADRIGGDRAEADAAVKAAKAAVRVAQLNVDFAVVKSPITGRVGDRHVDPGNLVKADDTILTTIVSLDPMHVSFDVDERSVLRLRRMVREGKMPSARTSKVEVDIGLADEDGFSLKGTIDFVDNRIDVGSGTLRLRAELPNAQKLLSPGLFVRVRLPIGLAHEALLVPEEALGSDQGQRFLFILDENDTVVYRPVKIGSLQEGLRVIEEGVSAKDRVIVNGLQRVRNKMKVTPKPAKAG